MTSNIDIDNSFIGYKKYNGCIFREFINKKLKNGYYVVNLDDADNDGTHWVGLIISTNKCFYFDPFGVYPPEEVKLLKRHNPNPLFCRF